ncbi:MAG: VWA domain-containing protein, partial [Treponema sp.]|nr:VWA domain-containing protein [Treponema sp.]
MKRMFYAFVLLFGAAFSVSGQNRGPVDLVLLLDTSSSMSGSYREVNDYLIGPFLREFLRIGDTFHFVPFSGGAAVDIARRIEGQGDVGTIVGRMLLAYPVGPDSNVEGALSFAEQYVSTLPASRGKKIVLVTDGGGVSSLASLVDTAKSRLASRGISLDLVSVPFAALPSPGRPQARRPGTDQTAPAETAVPPRGRTAEARPGTDARTAESGRPPSRDLADASVSDVPGTAESGDTGPAGSGAGIAAGPSAPAGEEAAPLPSPETPPAPEPAAPAGESREAERARNSGFPVFSLGMLPYIAGLVILVLLVLGIILFAAGKNLHGSPNRAISRAASAQASRQAEPPPQQQPPQQPRQPKDGNTDLLTSYAASRRPRVSPYAHRYKPQPVEYEGPLMLNLF